MRLKSPDIQGMEEHTSLRGALSSPLTPLISAAPSSQRVPAMAPFSFEAAFLQRVIKAATPAPAPVIYELCRLKTQPSGLLSEARSDETPPRFR